MGAGQGHTEPPQQPCLGGYSGHDKTTSEMPAGSLAMASLPFLTLWLPVPPPQLFLFILIGKLLPKAVPCSVSPAHCASLSQESCHHPKTHRFRAHVAAPSHALFFIEVGHSPICLASRGWASRVAAIHMRITYNMAYVILGVGMVL